MKIMNMLFYEFKPIKLTCKKWQQNYYVLFFVITAQLSYGLECNFIFL
jgi:hypothetical protein